MYGRPYFQYETSFFSTHGFSMVMLDDHFRAGFCFFLSPSYCSPEQLEFVKPNHQTFRSTARHDHWTCTVPLVFRRFFRWNCNRFTTRTLGMKWPMICVTPLSECDLRMTIYIVQVVEKQPIYFVKLVGCHCPFLGQHWGPLCLLEIVLLGGSISGSQPQFMERAWKGKNPS